MSEPAAVAVPAGASAAPGGNDGPGARLRAAGVEAKAGDAPRGRGRPKGSTTKKPAEAAAEVSKPSKDPAFVHSKVGKAFRCLGNLAALNTNCRVWLVTPEEEKDLGESVGDILCELGFADTLAAKVVFAVGTVSAVVGSKAITYAAWKQQMTAEAQAAGKIPPPVPVPPAAEKAADASIIPEAKPGVI